MTRLVSLGIAAQELGVHPDTLRRWEEEGRIEPPERTPGGRRRYDLAKLRTPYPACGPVVKGDYCLYSYHHKRTKGRSGPAGGVLGGALAVSLVRVSTLRAT
ncbi:MAG: MerR family DNA-binding transcriptional regulator [Ferrimicrobium sp.]